MVSYQVSFSPHLPRSLFQSVLPLALRMLKKEVVRKRNMLHKKGGARHPKNVASWDRRSKKKESRQGILTIFSASTPLFIV